VRLDLSRNPMLDIPKDFLDSCSQLRELSLAGSALKRVPVNVRYASGMRWLDLSSNRIHRLDDAAFDAAPQLTTLKLQNNRIETLPPWFSRLQKLRHLNISNNKLDRLPDVVAEMTWLVDLDISFNTMAAFPPQILALTQLEQLIFVSNRIENFPQDCSGLTRLRILDCRMNLLVDLTPVCRLPRLEQLLAEGNNVHALDLTLGPALHTLEVGKNDITRLVLMPGPQPTYSLATLDVSHAKLSSLDDAVLGQLTSLAHLTLDDNQFRSVPATLGRLTNLITLSFTDNQVDVLPDSIGELSKLETLNVRNNNLTVIPASIWRCGSLRTLNATSNVLHTFEAPLPSGVFYKEPQYADPSGVFIEFIELEEPQPLCRSLRHLYLGDNHLTDDVYFAIQHLQCLRLLNLSLNEITTLAHWTSSLETIEELYLSGNKITALPDAMHKVFGGLTTLYMNGNKLQSIPADLHKLRDLCVLDVGNNQLKYNINNLLYEWNWSVPISSRPPDSQLIPLIGTSILVCGTSTCRATGDSRSSLITLLERRWSHSQTKTRLLGLRHCCLNSQHVLSPLPHSLKSPARPSRPSPR
jgi:adenylate cyclase